jgi:hypothetical protein
VAIKVIDLLILCIAELGEWEDAQEAAQGALHVFQVQGENKL